MPTPDPPVVPAFVLYTIVDASKVDGSGDDELISVMDTLGNTRPLLVVSSSNREALFIVVELSPIFIWALAANCRHSRHAK